MELKSTVRATIFTTSPTENIKPNLTIADVSCEIKFTDVSTHPAFIFSYSLIFLISLVLNSITMWMYFCNNQRVQSSITVYLKNLAAADFFLCLCLPLRILNNSYDSMTIRNIYCSFGATAFYLNMYASILFMNFIAANRYLKIVRPLESHTLQTVRTAHIVSIATWLSLLATSCIFLILFLQTSWGYDQQHISCESMHSTQLKVFYNISHCMSFVVFLNVLVSMIVLYWKTLKKVQQAQLATQTTSSIHMFNKSKHNMLILVVVFCVCFVPYHLVRLPYIFITDCTAVYALNILKEVTILLGVLNVCFDPLIYFVFCKAFRAQLRKKKDLHRSSEEQT